MGLFRFVVFFIISLVAIIFLLDSITNHFIDAFVIALVFGLLGGMQD